MTARRKFVKRDKDGKVVEIRYLEPHSTPDYRVTQWDMDQGLRRTRPKLTDPQTPKKRR